jgi:hypothetical protein
VHHLRANAQGIGARPNRRSSAALRQPGMPEVPNVILGSILVADDGYPGEGLVA